MKFEEHDTFRAFATIQSKCNYVFFCTPNIDAKLKTSKNTKNSSSEKKWFTPESLKYQIISVI